MRALSIILGAICVILLLPGVLGAINSFLQTDLTEQYDVTTAVSQNTTTVTLTHELFGEDTISATVTSNITTDAPIARTYTVATKQLLVSGLDDNNSRRLTIVYYTDGLWYFPGAGVAAKMWPLFIILGVIGLIVAAVISAARRGE